MARLAWFTPLPPDRSGIAAYSAEILPLLAGRHAIDVFVDVPWGRVLPPTPARTGRAPDPPRPLRVLAAHDFVWRNTLDPYDLAVYQLGNATCHDYMWAYLSRYPGLVVLHDGQLHMARARQLLADQRFEDYGEELIYSHPEAPPGLARLVESGLGGRLFYFWPLLRTVVDSARLLAVHGAWVASEIREAFQAAAVEILPMGVAAPEPRDVAAARERLGAGAASVVFAAFGRVTPEKRITPILHALRQVEAHVPNIRLALVGEPADYYDVEAEARRAGVGDLVTVTGYVDAADLSSFLTAADVCLCLRWPSGRETSASWLRALAAGKPTIITDLAHTSGVTALDPRSWAVLPGRVSPASQGGGGQEPLTVAVDILDEQHSLTLAMRRLGVDAELRTHLGREARLAWERGHTLAHMEEAYARAIARALECPLPERARLPGHLLADGTAAARSIAGELGVTLDFL